MEPVYRCHPSIRVYGQLSVGTCGSFIIEFAAVKHVPLLQYTDYTSFTFPALKGVFVQRKENFLEYYLYLPKKIFKLWFLVLSTCIHSSFCTPKCTLRIL